MDSAKAIAVEATHKGTSWDYRWCSKTQPTKKTLPVVAVSTTSGTGSQVTQVAVMTNTELRDKSAIYNSIIYPRAAIVDPELMLSVPEHIMHGESLAVTYPSFTRYTCAHAVGKFAVLGRILNPALSSKSDEYAAKESCNELDRFLHKIGMWLSLKGLDVPENELPALGKQCMVLPDYQANPGVATMDDVMTILRESYSRP